MNRRVLTVGAAVTVPLLVVLAVGLRHDPREIASPLIGRPAPGFHLDPVSGGPPVSLDELRGNPVVINFWATWCGPCSDEQPVLLEAAHAFQSRVRFIGIVYDDTRENAIDYLRAAGSSYPSLVDPDGSTAIAFGVYGVPETFFINASGRIVAKHQGPLARTQLLDYLRVAQEAWQ